MAEKVIVNKSKLTAIGNSLREKTGKSESFTLDQMASEIVDIQTGVDTSDGTANADNMLAGTVAYSKDKRIVGTIQTYDYEGVGGSENRLNQLINKTITEITLSDLEGATEIWENFCYNNDNLISVELPNTIKTLNAYAFMNCGNLDKTYYYGTLEEWCDITINFKTAIDRNGNPMMSTQHFYLKDNNNSFYELSGELIIPNTITSIKAYCLTGNKQLTKINTNETIEIKDYSFALMPNLKVMECPKIVTLNNGLVSQCSLVESVYLPLVKDIKGARTFQSCHSLKKIYIEQAESVCTMKQTNNFTSCYHFDGTVNSTYNPEGLKDGYIYVPASRLAEYKVATNWITYASQIIGHQDFNVGDTLPDYTTSDFTTQTWYNDETLTTVVTSVATAGKYYCRLEA